MQLLGSTFNLVYMQDLCPARLQSKMVGDNDKSVVMGVLLSLWALTTAFQHQFAIIYNLIFQTYEQQHWPSTLHISIVFISQRYSELSAL